MTYVYLVIRHNDSYTDSRRFDYKICASKEYVKGAILNDAEYNDAMVDEEANFSKMYDVGLPNFVPALNTNKIWWEIRDMEVLGADE